MRRRRRNRRRGGGRMRRRRGECTPPPDGELRSKWSGASQDCPLRQPRARRAPAGRWRHSANLHRISSRTRSTGMTLEGRIRVSVFGIPEPKKRRGPARGGSGSGLDFHYSDRPRVSPHHVGGLRCVEPHVLCFCETTLCPSGGMFYAVDLCNRTSLDSRRSSDQSAYGR